MATTQTANSDKATSKTVKKDSVIGKVRIYQDTIRYKTRTGLEGDMEAVQMIMTNPFDKVEDDIPLQVKAYGYDTKKRAGFAYDSVGKLTTENLEEFTLDVIVRHTQFVQKKGKDRGKFRSSVSLEMIVPWDKDRKYYVEPQLDAFKVVLDRQVQEYLNITES